MSMGTKLEYAEYFPDGSVEISGCKDGLPRFTGVVPAPDVNTSSEEERVRRHNQACDALYLRGYFIVSRRRVRNPAFDRQGQRTTLKVIYRPCKNKREVEQVHREIKRIIGGGCRDPL